MPDLADRGLADSGLLIDIPAFRSALAEDRRGAIIDGGKPNGRHIDCAFSLEHEIEIVVEAWRLAVTSPAELIVPDQRPGTQWFSKDLLDALPSAN